MLSLVRKNTFFVKRTQICFDARKKKTFCFEKFSLTREENGSKKIFFCRKTSQNFLCQKKSFLLTKIFFEKIIFCVKKNCFCEKNSFFKNYFLCEKKIDFAKIIFFLRKKFFFQNNFLCMTNFLCEKNFL